MAIILKNEHFNYFLTSRFFSVIFGSLCVLCDLSGEKMISGEKMMPL
jgi:hypothetical protein